MSYRAPTICRSLLPNVLLGLGLSVAGCGEHSSSGGVPTDLPALPVPESGLATQYRIEPSHRGVAPPGTQVGTALSLAWKTARQAVGYYTASKSSPAVDDQLVFVGNDDGRLLAFDKGDGSLRWEFRSRMWDIEQARADQQHRGIHGTPAFDDTHVYVGDYAGYVYAVDKSTGERIWESKLGDYIGSSPTLYDGYLFVAVEYRNPDGKVHVVEALTGERVYETPYLGGHPHSSVSLDVSRGYMFVGANNGRFFCFDFVNGTERWRVETGGPIKSTAAVGDDVVYITSWDTKLHAFDIETGQSVFAFETQMRTMSSPSIDDQAAYVGSHDGSVYAVELHTGALRWKFDTGGSVQASATIITGTGLLAIGSRSDEVFLLHLEDAAVGWRYDLGADVTSVPVATGDSLFVFDDRGRLWRFKNP